MRSPSKLNNRTELIPNASKLSPNKMPRMSGASEITRMEFEEEINYGLWEEGKRVMWFEKEF